MSKAAFISNPNVDNMTHNLEYRSLDLTMPKTMPYTSKRGEKLKGSKQINVIQSGMEEYPKIDTPKPKPKRTDQYIVTIHIANGEITAIRATTKWSGCFLEAL